MLPPLPPPLPEQSLGDVVPETPRQIVEREGRLSDDEYGFILDTTLRNKHREDPAVLVFIDAFIRCKNIGQAAAEAGVHTKIGYSWRHQKDIAVAIQKLIDRSAVKYGFDASELIERTKEMVDFDPIEMQNPDGTFKSNMHDIAPEARRNLKKLKVRNIWGETEDINGVKTKLIIGELIEYEFYDKQKAIELVGKEKELFKNTTRVEHTISDNMASILLESAKRGQQASLVFGQKVRDVEGEVI